MQEGNPTILPNIEGQNITPSVVLFPSTDAGEEPLGYINTAESEQNKGDAGYAK